VLALDVERDLSLLAVPDTTLLPLRWSDGRAPMGRPLATIGYGLPEGGVVDTARAAVKSEYTVFRRFTAGFSSGYRTLEPGDPSTNVLEVDLFLFPGVSGGPTFDLDGRVVGVNQGQHRYRAGGSTSYGRVIPRLVVGQFLELHKDVSGLDSASVFRGPSDV
jgi:S1-C subfamily serine protease